MKTILRKLKSRRGDSFIEILVAILVAAFGCLLIATMYTSAMNMNIEASKADDSYYGALSDMEKMFGKDASASGSGKVTITDMTNSEHTSSTVTVQFFGNEQNSAYKR